MRLGVGLDPRFRGGGQRLAVLDHLIDQPFGQSLLWVAPLAFQKVGQGAFQPQLVGQAHHAARARQQAEADFGRPTFAFGSSTITR